MPRIGTVTSAASFTRSRGTRADPSPLAAERVAVLPSGAVLIVGSEARGVLALGARDARAAVGITLAIRERKTLQVDVRRRVRARRRRGRRDLRRARARGEHERGGSG